jgi:capsular exopolysaccharide synthesis family protein
MSAEPGVAGSLRDYGQLIRRRKWWVIWLGLAGLVLSLGLALHEAKQYSATAQVVVQSATTSAAASTVQEPVTTAQVQTMMLMVTGSPVQRSVEQKLGSAPPVQAAEVEQTNAISITAVDASPRRAALIANTYAQAFVTYQQNLAIRTTSAAEAQLSAQIRKLKKEIHTLKRTAGTASEITALVNEEGTLGEQLSQLQVNEAGNSAPVALIAPAVAPTSPSSPKPVQDGALGLVAGLGLGLGAAFLRENLDDALTSQDAAEQAAGSPVLAIVPLVSSWKRRDRPLVISISRPASPAAEAYRSLRTSLQFASQEREIRTVLVTSASSEEGKTTTLANLGAVFAQAGHRVVLVSCDLRRPRLGEFLGVDESAGLTTVLNGQHTLQDVVQPVTRDMRMCVLPAGPPPPNPSELIDGPGMRDVFATLRENFDIVLIDSPPVLPVTDAVMLSRLTDTTLVVVAAGQTHKGELQRAAARLEQVNAPVSGLVLNEVRRLGSRAYGYYGGYGSYYGQLPEAEQPAGRQGGRRSQRSR